MWVTAYVEVEFIVEVSRSSLLCRRQVWLTLIVVFLMTCIYLRSGLKLQMFRFEHIIKYIIFLNNVKLLFQILSLQIRIY